VGDVGNREGEVGILEVGNADVDGLSTTVAPSDMPKVASRIVGGVFATVTGGRSASNTLI